LNQLKCRAASDLKNKMRRNVGVKDIRCWRSTIDQKRLARLQRENVSSAELSPVTRGRYQLTTSTFNRRASPRLETACRRWLRTSRYDTARRGAARLIFRARDGIHCRDFFKISALRANEKGWEKENKERKRESF